MKGFDSMSDTALMVRNITKSYGSTRALVDVDLELARGEIIALLGENGAGKSTLARIICGLERSDSGALLIDGREVTFGTPREARHHGIFLIPQELAFVPDLSAAENIMLGRLPHSGGVTTQRAVVAAAQREAARFGFDIPLRAPMRSLPLADQQMVEILKALRLRARAIVLDEPTASLTEDESARLFAALRMIAATGTSMVFVSHKLDEVLGGTDRVCVLRDGRLVWSASTSTTSRDALLQAMLGKPFRVRATTSQTSRDQGTGLAVHDWSTADGVLKLSSVDFAPSEITVLFGLRGSGSDALAEGIAGARATAGGRMVVGTRSVPRPATPRGAHRAGIAYVPPD